MGLQPSGFTVIGTYLLRDGDMPSLNRRNEPQPKRQGGNNRKIYQSARWHRTSKQHRKANPLCVMCLKEGITKLAEELDHIVPIEEGGAIWDTTNHQGLCKSHHSKKTYLETHKKHTNEQE